MISAVRRISPIMKKPLNKEKLQAFIQRRRINAICLLVIMLFSALITVICAFKHFARTDLLAAVTLLLVILCFIQEIKLRRSFRTIRSFKGIHRRKKPRHSEE